MSIERIVFRSSRKCNRLFRHWFKSLFLCRNNSLWDFSLLSHPFKLTLLVLTIGGIQSALAVAPSAVKNESSSYFAHVFSDKWVFRNLFQSRDTPAFIFSFEDFQLDFPTVLYHSIWTSFVTRTTKNKTVSSLISLLLWICNFLWASSEWDGVD